ncbi:MAG: hypothetical protein ABI597_04805 [Gammaproteobacteria bacterium]
MNNIIRKDASNHRMPNHANPVNAEWEMISFQEKQKKLENQCVQAIESLLLANISKDKKNSRNTFLMNTFNRIIQAENLEEINLYKDTFLFAINDTKSSSCAQTTELLIKINELYLLRLAYLASVNAQAKKALKEILKIGASTAISLISINVLVLDVLKAAASYAHGIHTDTRYKNSQARVEKWQRVKEVFKGYVQNGKRFCREHKKILSVLLPIALAGTIASLIFFPLPAILFVTMIAASVATAIIAAKSLYDVYRVEKLRDQRIIQRMNEHNADLLHYRMSRSKKIKLSTHKVSVQQGQHNTTKKAAYSFRTLFHYVQRKPLIAVAIGLAAIVGGFFGLSIAIAVLAIGSAHALLVAAAHAAAATHVAVTGSVVITTKLLCTALGATCSGAATSKLVNEKLPADDAKPITSNSARNQFFSTRKNHERTNQRDVSMVSLGKNALSNNKVT